MFDEQAAFSWYPQGPSPPLPIKRVPSGRMASLAFAQERCLGEAARSTTGRVLDLAASPLAGTARHAKTRALIQGTRHMKQVARVF
jgi:hypothetical protein